MAENKEQKIYRNTLNEELNELEDVQKGFIEENEEELSKNIKIDEDFNAIENIRSFLKSTEENIEVFDDYDVHKEDTLKNKKEFLEREEFIKETLKPSKDYEELAEKEVVRGEHTTTSRYKKENFKSTISLIIIFILFFLSLFFLLHVDEILPSGRDLNKSKTLYTNENIVEIDGNLISYNKQDSIINVYIEIKKI